ncbi:MAG: LysR family transcriptional regulator [Fusicatenibacter sp.]
MDSNAIESFIVLYETKNMHKAAEKLYISQQGLSGIIRNLEKEWETVLFERSSGGMIPTKTGDFFNQEALKIRKQLTDMRHIISYMDSGKEEIILACSFGALQVMYPVLKQFEAIYPRFQIQWTEYSDAEADKKVMNLDADLGLCICLEHAKDLMFEPLFTIKVVLLVSGGGGLPEYRCKDCGDQFLSASLPA